MKRMILMLILFVSTFTISSRPVQTYAYTEEEKQQAKDWLSAHGYAPTRSGAQQAYQDYKSGKLYIPGYSPEPKESDTSENKGAKKQASTEKSTSKSMKKKKINPKKKPVAAIRQSILDRADELVKNAKNQKTSTTENKNVTTTEVSDSISKPQKKDTVKKSNQGLFAVGAVFAIVIAGGCTYWYRKKIKKKS